MMTMRLQRLHFSSNPWPRTLAINCPHSQRVSLFWQGENADVLVDIVRGGHFRG